MRASTTVQRLTERVRRAVHKGRSLEFSVGTGTPPEPNKDNYDLIAELGL